MTPELETLIARLRQAWMSGAPLPEVLPAQWKALTQNDETPSIVCLALVGQAIETCFIPSPPSELKRTPPLPKLALPTLPITARKSFQRALAALRSEAIDPLFLIRLMVTRGYVAHPEDWMPDKHTHVPAEYANWIGWLNEQSADETEPGQLTTENWTDFSPAERKHAFSLLRQNEPAKARALLEAHLAGEPAGHRADLVSCLDTKLTEEDADFLTSLNADKSRKVAAIADILLARLGIRKGNEENAKELADFLEFKSRGLIKKSRELICPPLKTDAQRNRRDELFDTVTLPDLAAAFDVTDIELIDALKERGHDPRAIGGFASLVAHTGSDLCVRRLSEKLLANDDLPAAGLKDLILRIPEPDRRPLLTRLLSRRESTLDLVTQSAGCHLGGFRKAELIATGQIQTVETWARSLDTDKVDRRLEHLAGAILTHLGLLADAVTANDLLELFIASGVSAADSRLNILRFNAMLERPDAHV